MKFLKYILFILLALPTVANAQSGRKSFAGVDSGTHYVRGFMRVGYASIFTTSPTYKLDINGNTFVGGQLVVNSSATEVSAVIGNSNSNKVRIGVGTSTLATTNECFLNFGTGAMTDPQITVSTSGRRMRFSSVSEWQLYGTSQLTPINIYGALYGPASGDVFRMGSLANAAGVPHYPTNGETNILVLPYHAGINSDFTPSSGNATYCALKIFPRIKQTGTANGKTYGIRVGTAIDSAYDWTSISIENNTGYGVEQTGSGAINKFRGLCGFGSTTTPTAAVHITKTNGYQQLILSTSYTPTSSADANGVVGTICWDDEYIYVRTSTGWKRTPGLSTF